MDIAAAARAVELFEGRGQLDRLERVEPSDAFRTAADAVVLSLGFRVRATAGGHRIATDIAHAALSAESSGFAPASAERFRQGRHESEYFDPSRPVDKSADDTGWALERAAVAIEAVRTALSAS